ncbi:hypothetical protein TVAG_370030 [Trichomonas vaginalis G3]|uniref:Uncharacterized protein n=1 Tax=Trichomonas vaginalis (strain ATCC PRA-98 / G3) TaxID=412133 RepID=A2EX55_TRIV3|nr:hypothetical protein TVAGG3_0860110 [Trichomonas vaginalis G3]EAY02775.1 hypothetical protein TVAG_370030 [Trichomonas vaginalis G3]KAI5500609.1 hypothetical protein TVAGG3_0860110 [Trichomonas vaginalis G3]|eukprot:XP_001314998.1 hypothetical protein [Trichomonas vaginalis G3]
MFEMDSDSDDETFGLTKPKVIEQRNDPKKQPRREKFFDHTDENNFFPDINQVLQKLDTNECIKPAKILRNPFKQELKASNQRLAQIKRGVPLMNIIPHELTIYPLLEEKLKYNGVADVISELPQDYKAGLIKKVDFVIPVRDKQVRPPPLSARINTADQITKRIQRLITKGDRLALKYHNEVISNINHANQRRARVMKQFNSDLNKYGFREASRRAQRASQKSRLRIISNHPWWPEFIDYAFSNSVTSEENQLIHDIAETENLNGPKLMGFIKDILENYQNPYRSMELIRWINNRCKIIDDNVLSIMNDQGMFSPESSKGHGIRRMNSVIYN